MAFRASNVIPANKYEQAKQLALQLQRYCQNQQNLFASGGTGSQILQTVENMRNIKSSLQECASTPGIATYAADQEDDNTYNVATEFTALIGSIDAVINEVVTTLPKDANGYLLVRKINLDGTLEERNFAAGALNPLRSLLGNVVSAVT